MLAPQIAGKIKDAAAALSGATSPSQGPWATNSRGWYFPVADRRYFPTAMSWSRSGTTAVTQNTTTLTWPACPSWSPFELRSCSHPIPSELGSAEDSTLFIHFDLLYIVVVSFPLLAFYWLYNQTCT